jgi:hypothetical protein
MKTNNGNGNPAYLGAACVYNLDQLGFTALPGLTSGQNQGARRQPRMRPGLFRRFPKLPKFGWFG